MIQLLWTSCSRGRLVCIQWPSPSFHDRPLWRKQLWCSHFFFIALNELITGLSNPLSVLQTDKQALLWGSAWVCSHTACLLHSEPAEWSCALRWSTVSSVVAMLGPHLNKKKCHWILWPWKAMCVDDVADITQFYSTRNTFTGNRGKM